MDCIVHGATKSQKQLSNSHFLFTLAIYYFLLFFVYLSKHILTENIQMFL